MTGPKTAGKRPAALTDHELDVLAAAFLPSKGVYWLPTLDTFVISDGNRTRAGRAMRNCGYIRVSPGRVAWLPFVAGAGKRKTDQPARLMELTPKGVDALRTRMGPDSFRQLQVLARERQQGASS